MTDQAKHPAVKRFEQAFAQKIGLPHAFAFWKGRVGLYSILRALDVKAGDEVILPGYTCVMNVNPVMYLGAKPIYVDIDPVTYNIRPDLVAQKITPRTKVIIAQHTYGYPCDMDPLLELARQHNLHVVEDCCLALGSKYKGRNCGTMGAAAYWSFQWNKTFTTGIGGMAATADAKLAESIQRVCGDMVQPSTKDAWVLAMQRLVYRAAIYPRTTAIATSMFRWLTKVGLVVGSSSNAEYRPEMPADFFKAMSPGQARAGLAGIRRWDANVQHRHQMRAEYDRLLSASGWNIPALPAWMEPSMIRYPLRVSDKAAVVAQGPGKLLEIGTWYECTLHPIETPLRLYDYIDGMCPEAEKAAREVINLPTHPRSTPKIARASVEFINQFKIQ